MIVRRRKSSFPWMNHFLQFLPRASLTFSWRLKCSRHKFVRGNAFLLKKAMMWHRKRSIQSLIYIAIYIYGIHHWRILGSSYIKLAWKGFEPSTTEFRSDALTEWAIRPWVQLPLRANFVQLLQFHLLFSAKCQISYKWT